MTRTQILNSLQRFFKIKHYKNSTKHTYLKYVIRFLDYMEVDDSRPSSLTINDAQDFLVYIIEEVEASNSTYNVHVEALRALFRGVYHIAGVKEFLPKIRQGKSIKPHFTHEQGIALLENCRDLRLRAQIALAFGCGLRISEVASLQFKHIKKAHSCIFVENSKWGRDRLVPYSKTVAECLNEYCKTLKNRSPEAYLFPHTEKPCMHTTQKEITDPFLAYLQGFDFVLPGHSFHSLRHTYATRLSMKGVPLPKIQEAMGHSSAATTSNYIHEDEPWDGEFPDVLKRD